MNILIPVFLLLQTFIFKGDPPARFNVEELRSEISAVAPNVEIEFNAAINWNAFPYDNTHPDYPVDPSLPWVEIGVLTVSNVPDNITRQQVKNFILNHSATETPEEERFRQRVEKLKPLLLQLIQNDPDVRLKLGLP